MLSSLGSRNTVSLFVIARFQYNNWTAEEVELPSFGFVTFVVCELQAFPLGSSQHKCTFIIVVSFSSTIVLLCTISEIEH